jgi:CheY-like chemotaxis protein
VPSFTTTTYDPRVTADDPAVTERATHRVLVVDDDELNRRVAAGLCAGLGLAVDAAAGGRAALTRLSERPFDLVLLDDRMPGLDGAGVVGELRRRETMAGLPPVPVIAITASVLPEDRDRLLAAGVDACLAKPLLAAELASVVAALLPADEPPRTRVIPA